MSYQPLVPLGGLAGWRHLQRTAETQREAFAASPATARELAYFSETIAQADSPEALVSDHQLLKVALGAFGLGEEIGKKALIRKVLEEGTEERTAFANRMVDPRYRDFAKAFGYGDAAGPQVAREGFAEEIAARYRVMRFEEAVGAVDDDMRLALAFERGVKALASAGLSDDAAWMRVLGDKPLRAVFEAAFGLPKQFAALDVDRQRDDLTARAERLFGSDGFAALADPENRDRVLRDFFIRRQIENGPGATTPGMAALTLLQNATGPGAMRNLFLSNLG